MKKIIKGKIYDTAAAKEIHNISDEVSTIKLYQKKNGECFIYAYAKEINVEAVAPVTYDYAEEWLARNAPEKSLEPVHPDNDKAKVISISMKESELSKIKRNAARSGMTVSTFIVMMCAE